VVLAKVGERFGQLGGTTKLSLPTYHPLAVLRMLRALMISKLAKRPLLPKDLWRICGLVCGGTDISIYRDMIGYYWGVQPLDVYISTETCFIAMQGWNKKGMTFVPYNNFYEFVPEEEWLKSRDDHSYQPSTVLLDEVEEGKTYEIVITNFNGGAFVRYRIGDLIKIEALKDEETGVNLPQMTFQSRADDVIDIAGFARLDEKTIWQAIHNLGIPYVDWSTRKEVRDGKPVLNIYIELTKSTVHQKDELEQLIDRELIALNTDYKDFRDISGSMPLIVTLLNEGAFQNFENKKAAAGFDLAHLKPPHINPSDSVIEDLLSTGQDS
jgi:phenylacetate-coenzyme A ligase PaaK-like adenylate-forming protein